MRVEVDEDLRGDGFTNSQLSSEVPNVERIFVGSPIYVEQLAK